MRNIAYARPACSPSGRRLCSIGHGRLRPAGGARLARHRSSIAPAGTSTPSSTNSRTSSPRRSTRRTRRQPLPAFQPTGRGRVLLQPPSAVDTVRARHRDLRSDFLMVKSPETSALVPFRDVLEVDGQPVRDREARLAKLFLGAPADVMAQAERIGDEGARYNLGNMRSTIGQSSARARRAAEGLPAAVSVLARQGRQVGRSRRLDRRVQGGQGAVDDSRRSRRRSAFRTGASGSIRSTVACCKTELQVEQPAIRAVVTTTFRVDEHSGIAVPRGDARALHLRQRQPREHGRDLRPLPPLRRQRERGHQHAAQPHHR